VAFAPPVLEILLLRVAPDVDIAETVGAVSVGGLTVAVGAGVEVGQGRVVNVLVEPYPGPVEFVAKA
jgi:hypothetical protein